MAHVSPAYNYKCSLIRAFIQGMGGAYLNYMTAETFSFNLRSFPCEGAVLTREIKSYKMVDTKTAYKIKHEQF